MGLQWTALDFRHTFGSHLAMKGTSLFKISTLMGNTPEVARKHYVALLPESLVGAVEFSAKPPPQTSQNRGSAAPTLPEGWRVVG